MRSSTLCIIKLTAIILLAACLKVSANSYSKGITLSMKNVTLEKVFEEIKKQSGYYFLYNNNLLQQAKKVDVEIKDATIEQAMEVCLKGQPLTYAIVDNLVVIKSKGEPASKPPQLPQDTTRSIKGKVMNEKGEAVPGVTIAVKGSGKGSFTNNAGEFSIADIAPDATLLISSVGYEAQEVSVKGKASIEILLKTAIGILDETVVIAYGTTTQRYNTSNVSAVRAEDIEKQPVTNPLLTLQGRVPGLFITQNTGVPGGGINILIRGQNSINNGYDPFYVIDGVPYVSQLLANLAGGILQQSNGNYAQGAGNPLNFINPSDIESISVLKDADATAIYGSRGANGVVLITTKKGKPGKTKVAFNVSTGISKVGREIDYLKTQQYLQIRREAFKNDGITPDEFNAPDLIVWDTTGFTNWQKELIGGTAHYTDVQASISGGSPNTQYLIGGNFHKETTVFPGEFSDKKGSVHFNINNVSANQKFKATFSGRYMTDNGNLPSTDFTSYLSILPPHANPYNPDGSLNWENYNWGIDNPFALTKRVYKVRANNLVSNLNLSYYLLKGLEVMSNFGYTNMQVNEISTVPISSLNPMSAIKTGTASFTNNSIRSWIVEPQITYQLRAGHGRIEALVGTTFQRNINEGQISSATGYTSDALLENIQAAPTITINSVTNTIYKYNAVFARLNYNLRNKYILNFTARRDGSSRFGDNNKFHNFGSVGAAWIFSEEGFVQGALPFLSFGKLRASYGTTGNDQIGDYRFYDLFNTTRYSYQGTVGLTPVSLYNADLAWEETKKLEGGLDLGFLKDRILLNVSYYHNRSSNQLLSYTLPTVTGFSLIPANFPATVQNTGWEFLLNTTNIKKKNFSWTSSINFTIPRNKLVAFPNLANTSYQYALVIGQPVAIIKAFHLIGVNDTTGVYQFADSKGSPTYNPAYGTDDIVPISTAPKFYGGFSNTFSYKGFQLDFIFQFTKQLGVNHLFQGFSPPGFLGTNISPDILNRWKKIGDKAPIQQFAQSYSSNAFIAYLYAKQSDYGYTGASFIRLKNLSLSYQLPVAWINKIHLQNCRIYIQGQNLLTITKYKGIDPENQNLIALPPLRVITGGIELSL